MKTTENDYSDLLKIPGDTISGIERLFSSSWHARQPKKIKVKKNSKKGGDRLIVLLVFHGKEKPKCMDNEKGKRRRDYSWIDDLCRAIENGERTGDK